MRQLFLCAALTSLGTAPAIAQGMVEQGLLVGSGASAAAGAGKALGGSLQKTFGGLAGATAAAAGQGSKPSPFGDTGGRRAQDLPTIPDGPAAERERVSAMPTSRRKATEQSDESPQVIHAKAVPPASATAPHREPAHVEEGEAVAKVRKAAFTADDFKTVEAGTELRELVAKVGIPSARFAMFEDGHLNETLRWETRAGLVARIKSVDGKIVSVEIPN